MSVPTVSICLPNLNTRPFLEERMESLVNQTFTDWELVVSDNYSDDGSCEFLQTYTGDPRIKLEQAPREGMYANWNNCLQRAQGEYVYIATSDDSSCPTMLEKLVAPLEQFRDVDLSVCAYDETDVDGNVLKPYVDEEAAFLADWLGRPHRRSGKAEFLIQMCLGCHWKTITAVLFRRSLLEKTGLFYTDCLSCADTPWRAKAALNSDLIYIPESLATWRQHPTQATANLPASRERLIYGAIERAVRELDEQIPVQWKKTSDYMERILFQRRRRYLMEFHLHRGALQHHPRDFWKGFCRAAFVEPGYWFERLRTGFTWDSPWFGDRVKYMLDLFDEWDVPWPPETVKL